MSATQGDPKRPVNPQDPKTLEPDSMAVEIALQGSAELEINDIQSLFQAASEGPPAPAGEWQGVEVVEAELMFLAPPQAGAAESLASQSMSIAIPAEKVLPIRQEQQGAEGYSEKTVEISERPESRPSPSLSRTIPASAATGIVTTPSRSRSDEGEILTDQPYGRDAIDAKLEGLRQEVRSTVAQEVGSIRIQLAQEVGTVKTEIATQVGTLKTEISKQIGAANADLASKTGDLKADLSKQIGAVNTEIATKIGDLKTQVEASLGGVKTSVGKLDTAMKIYGAIASALLTALSAGMIKLVFFPDYGHGPPPHSGQASQTK